MIIMDPSRLDLSKYKRIFFFGCSFTQYRWPTWATIIARCAPHAEYHNLGMCGAGQEFISTNINQIINGVELEETDLVFVMWSTFYREDRYKFHQLARFEPTPNWICEGNLYTAGKNEDWLRHCICPRGLTIKSLATIDNTIRVLETQQCDVVNFMSLSIDDQTRMAPAEIDEMNLPMDDIKLMYAHLEDRIAATLFDAIKDPETGNWRTGYSWFDHERDEMWHDYHPTILDYADFVEIAGISIPSDVYASLEYEHAHWLKIDGRDVGDWPRPRLLL